MSDISDHPLRYKLTNELHARPFPAFDAPGFAVFLAIKSPQDDINLDREANLRHLLDLLDRFGAAHPREGATHYFGEIGNHTLKWEQHTEFVTYTIFGNENAEKPFDPATFHLFPKEWLAKAPGARITSALIRVELQDDEAVIKQKTRKWLVRESLTISSMLQGSMIVAGDFRIDTAGHMRFAVFAHPETGARRTGRMVQRLCEIETYKAMSMLGFSTAQNLSGQLSELDDTLSKLVDAMGDNSIPADITLKSLLEVSAELENLMAKSSYRFAATRAYETLVSQRIEVLHEERFMGHQTFVEFMLRRYSPAMRTVKSTQNRLRDIGGAATRAGELLRTRVDVERSTQNQKLLESMDKRADQQLRLQTTVEGLSIVAISYYAVNLAAYLSYPFTGALGISKGLSLAILTPIVVFIMWMLVRRIRKRFH